MRNRIILMTSTTRLIEVPLSIVLWISRFCIIDVLADKTLYYQTSPCPNYSPWKKAIAISGAVLRSSGEFHGDCRITFQVPYPDRQRFLLRFESVDIKECHDRLVIYDSDDLVDAARLEEISCRSQVDPTRFMYTSNSGGYVTIRYYTYNKGEQASVFRLVLTAVNKQHRSEPCGFRCINSGHCISTELRCDSDHVNHCGDNSDEANCRNSLKESASQAEYAAREFLGLSISVTLVISLSVLFVIGVCVCSIALFGCKRNQMPGQNTSLLQPGPQPALTVDAMSSSEATSSTGTSRSLTHDHYAPGNNELHHANERHENRVFHGKSRPSPLLAYHSPITHSTVPSTYSCSVPGTPRLVAHPYRTAIRQPNSVLNADDSRKRPVVYF